VQKKPCEERTQRHEAISTAVKINHHVRTSHQLVTSLFIQAGGGKQTRREKKQKTVSSE
jgi:hypothetical protein